MREKRWCWNGSRRGLIIARWTVPTVRRYLYCRATFGMNTGRTGPGHGSGNRRVSGAISGQEAERHIGSSEVICARCHDRKLMTTTAPKQRSRTAEQILDLAEILIQTRGYSAFSYQDISDALGMTKASIHYHFASKTDLGIAVVDRYVERFGAALIAIAEDQSQPSMAMLDFYIAPYLK